MTEPKWISQALVLRIHERQLAEHGGGSGIRAQDMLDSALLRPQQKWTYGQPPPDLPALAAALWALTWPWLLTGLGHLLGR